MGGTSRDYFSNPGGPSLLRCDQVIWRTISHSFKPKYAKSQQHAGFNASFRNFGIRVFCYSVFCSLTPFFKESSHRVRLGSHCGSNIICWRTLLSSKYAGAYESAAGRDVIDDIRDNYRGYIADEPPKEKTPLIFKGSFWVNLI